MVVESVPLGQVRVQLVFRLEPAKCSKVCRAFGEPLALEVQRACKAVELTGTARMEQRLAVNFGLGFQTTIKMTGPSWKRTDSKSNSGLMMRCC